jgi:hypothetical protein
MNINNFLNKENLTTLWDVISDEDIFKFLSRDIQGKVAQLFTNNVNGFFEIEKTKTSSLVEINKKYIMLILNHIKKTYTQQMPNKIKILDETPVKEIITAEELHNERKSQFDKDLFKRQSEFENIMTVKAPPVPNFLDKYEDKPIGEMDKIIKEMTSKRNYDVEQITKNSVVDDNWLKSQETSIKSEKITKQPPQITKELLPINESRFKYLNMDNQQQSPTKKVTWGNNSETSDSDLEENIFKKLKKVPKPEMEFDNNISLSFEEINNNESNNNSNNNNNNNDSNDDKIRLLQSEVKTLNSKLDLIIELLKKN